jgi:CRISPR system Cascade subunit CasD
MNVLLLRLAGPMQSWGVQSRYKERDTGLEPSKSGVIGLLCAALGRKRHEPIEDLKNLTMGVRADQGGSIEYDFHTAGKGGILRASGGVERDHVAVSIRYYLADARFLVGLEGDDLDLLTRLHTALRDPVWPLYLGRKAFVPGEPVWLKYGLMPKAELRAALETYPWLGPEGKAPEDQLRLVLEDPENGSEVRPDQPLSFAERRFAPRRVTTTFIPAPPLRKEDSLCTSPD